MPKEAPQSQVDPLDGILNKDCVAQAKVFRDIIKSMIDSGQMEKDSAAIDLILEEFRKKSVSRSRRFIENRLELLKLHRYIQDLVATGRINMRHGNEMCIEDLLHPDVQKYLVEQLRALDSSMKCKRLNQVSVGMIITQAYDIAKQIREAEEAKKPFIMPSEPSKPKLKLKKKKVKYEIPESLSAQCSLVVQLAMELSENILAVIRWHFSESKGNISSIDTEVREDLLLKLKEVEEVIQSLMSHIQDKGRKLGPIKDVKRPEKAFDDSKIQIDTQLSTIKESIDSLIGEISILRPQINDINAGLINKKTNLSPELKEARGCIECLEGLI